MLKSFAFEHEVLSLADIVPGVAEWGRFECLSDVFAYREEIREEIDLIEKMYKLHVGSIEVTLPSSTLTYVSGLKKDRLTTLEYENRTLTQWLVSRGFERAVEATPASNTGVANDPQA